MLNLLLVEAAVRSGLSAVCGTCSRYWEGRDKGLPEPCCTSRTKCGSPLAGDDFHAYSGPITEFDKLCFVCAEASRFGIIVRGRTRVVGVCATHVKLFSELHPVDALASEVLLKSASGTVFTSEQLCPKPVRSLSAAIAEVEHHYDSKAHS